VLRVTVVTAIMLLVRFAVSRGLTTASCCVARARAPPRSSIAAATPVTERRCYHRRARAPPPRTSVGSALSRTSVVATVACAHQCRTASPAPPPPCPRLHLRACLAEVGRDYWRLGVRGKKKEKKEKKTKEREKRMMEKGGKRKEREKRKREGK
jgi:hypothetical protein